MAVHIRLRRIGKKSKGKPHFRVTVFDERRGRDSRFIEELGFYNPIGPLIKLKKERIDFWVQKGAQLSATVKSLVRLLKKEGKDATGTNS